MSDASLLSEGSHHGDVRDDESEVADALLAMAQGSWEKIAPPSPSSGSATEPPEVAWDWELSPDDFGDLASDWDLSPDEIAEFASDGDLSPAIFDEVAFIKELEEMDGTDFCKPLPFEESVQAAPTVDSSAPPEPLSSDLSVQADPTAGSSAPPEQPSTSDSVHAAPTADFCPLPDPPSIDSTVQVNHAAGSSASPQQPSIGGPVQAAPEVDSSAPLTPFSPPSIDGSAEANNAAASSSSPLLPSIAGSVKTDPVKGASSPPAPPSIDGSVQAAPAAGPSTPLITPSINQSAQAASTAGKTAFVEGGMVSAARLGDHVNTESFAFVADNFAWDKGVAAAAMVLGDEDWPGPGDVTDEGVEGPGGINAVAGFRHVLLQDNAAFEADTAAAAMVVGDADWPTPGDAADGGVGTYGEMTAVAGFGRLVSLDSFAFEADAAAAAVVIGDDNWPAPRKPENASPADEMEAFPSTALSSLVTSSGGAEEEGVAPGPMIAASWSEVAAGGVLGFGEDPLSAEGGDPGDAHLEIHTTLKEAMMAVEFARKLHEEEEEENRRTVEKVEAEARWWKAVVEKRARHDSVVEDRRRWSVRVRAAALGECREERAVSSSPGALPSQAQRRQALKRATMGTRMERMRPRG